MALARLDKFNGMNNRADVTDLPPNSLAAITNLIVDNSRVLKMRPGYGFILSGLVSALWSDGERCFAVKDNNLVELNDDNTATTLAAGVGNYPVSFVGVDGKFFYSGSNTKGRITGATAVSFGLDKVLGYPALATITGTLELGRYQIAITHLDTNGFESGVGYYAVYEVTTANKGIGLSAIPVSSNPRVTHTCIYVSEANGSELYRRAVILNGTTTYSLTSLPGSYISLKTKSLDSGPLATILRYFYGRLYAVSGQVVYYSLPLDYEHWDYRQYLHYAATVTAFMPVEDGVWVAADGLYFIEGRNPEQFSQIKKADFTVFQGSDVLVPAQRFNNPNTYSAGWFATCKEGVLKLGNSGYFELVTAKSYHLPTGTTGAAGAIIEYLNSFNYVALLSPQDLSSWSAGDIIAPTPAPTPAQPESSLVYGQVAAGQDLGALKVVIAAAGGCVYCDATNPLHLNRVIGLTLQAYTTGQTAKVYYAGIVSNNAWNWSVAAGAVFAGANGELTQDLTGLVFNQRMGTAISATQLLLHLDQPIQIAEIPN